MKVSTSLLLLLLQFFSFFKNVHCFVKITTHRSLSTHHGLFLAGGGFGTSSGKSAAKKKPKKKKKNALLVDLPRATPKKKDDGPKLDRFGLPIQTEEDIFPKLGPEVEFIPASSSPDKTEILEALNGYIPINESLLDDAGDDNDMRVRLLHKSPPVLAIDNLFTESECNEYIDFIRNPSDEAVVQVSSPTFSQILPTISKRTSTSWFSYYKNVPLLLAKIRRVFPKVKLEQMEEPQLVLYQKGQEFSWHYDAVPPNHLKNGGQRLITFLVYLNTIQDGGGTIFRDLTSGGKEMVCMKPHQGSALIFFPSYGDGTPDERTLHKGEVVLEGEKMICQVWIHEQDYKASVPQGNRVGDAKELVTEVEKKLGYI